MKLRLPPLRPALTAIGGPCIAERLRALPAVQPGAAQAQIDAAVKAERDRCAKVALSEGEAMERAAQVFTPPRTHADDALYHMHIGGEQTAERIAAAIRGGQRP